MNETSPQDETLNRDTAEEETRTEDSVNTEEENAAQTEQPEAEPEVSEEEEQTGEEESTEEKPAKKERKLKWTRSAEKTSEKPVNPFEAKFNEISDKYARLFAEFDNFRKRSDKEKLQRYDFGAKDMVERILPVIDNFERGLAAVPEDKTEDPFVKGMEMTYKQLLKTLEDAGVKPIEAVGQKFNPDFHNAVMHVEDPEVGDNIIVEEFQKGYTYKEHVVRYSMVKVAN